MKILVVSDSHGDRDILAQLAERYQSQMDLMVHAGDSELAVDDDLFNVMPSVLGNNDFGQPFPEQRLIELETERILVAHGHLLNVNQTMNNLALLSREVDASITVFGHTHQLFVDLINGTLFINPGSISYPRGEYSWIGGTYAIIDAQTNSFNVQFYNRGFKPVPKLNFHFDRSVK